MSFGFRFPEILQWSCRPYAKCSSPSWFGTRPCNCYACSHILGSACPRSLSKVYRRQQRKFKLLLKYLRLVLQEKPRQLCWVWSFRTFPQNYSSRSVLLQTYYSSRAYPFRISWSYFRCSHSWCRDARQSYLPVKMGSRILRAAR